MFWRKKFSKIGFWFGVLCILGFLALSTLAFWYLVRPGVSTKELLLTAACSTLLLTPLSLAVAAVIAKVTRVWIEATEVWKDLALGLGGLLLFLLGIYGALFTSFTIVGKIVVIVGLVLTAAAPILQRFRSIFERATPKER